MRILVCGDREWTDRTTIYEQLANFSDYDEDITVITGGAKGADTLGDQLAKEIGFDREIYPANWVGYGKPAGPIRNRKMLNTGIDLVLAFHSNIENSKGTKDCITEAKKRGIEVKLFEGD